MFGLRGAFSVAVILIWYNFKQLQNPSLYFSDSWLDNRLGCGSNRNSNEKWNHTSRAMLWHTHGKTENVSMPYQQFQSCTSNELHFVQLMHVGSRFITKIKDFSLYGSFMFKLMHAIVSRTVYRDCVQCTTHLWRLVQSLSADGCRESPHIFLFSFLYNNDLTKWSSRSYR